jgi:tetratricopeptide (TPR) repeat protein
MIICNYRFPDGDGLLDDLQGPKKDGTLLRDALTDHETGMFDKANVHEPLNDGPSGEILKATEEFFKGAEPEDTLLFYYSGHGRTLGQQLYLCAHNTNPRLLLSTAVPGSVLKEIVESSLARVKILILDCCYSAMFKGDDETAITGLLGTGLYVLAATSAVERAADGARKGLPSPFTKALAEALTGKAEDLDGDGKVDLDDVYRYLKTVAFENARPHQNFEGSGSVHIARRPVNVLGCRAQAQPRGRDAEVGIADPGGDNFAYNYAFPSPGTDLPYLDRPAPGRSFSLELVAGFRAGMRAEARKGMPDSLTAAEFLEHAGLIQNGIITRAGVLLFSSRPTALLPAAVVQCVRFRGITNTAPHDSIIELHNAIPQLIERAYDFVAGIARIGEAPTGKSARAEPVYGYPMVALREIIANAVVHRDYEDLAANVQIFAFDDRIEVLSPGAWRGAPVAVEQRPLGELVQRSQRRNFRIAQTLTWSPLFEGLGAGVPRSVEDCAKVGAPEPLVAIDDDSVRVTLFPRPQPPVHVQRAVRAGEEAAVPRYGRGASPATIKREPTPPGPVTDLFARLDDLHSRAGLPSMRQIATMAGRGSISSSTVHNIFRLARVPSWPLLEEVVMALGGAQDREEFLTLWDAAWRAEIEAESPVQDEVTRQGRPSARSRWAVPGNAEPSRRIWSSEIPARNPDFTGRTGVLETIRGNLDSHQPPNVQVISGMGGIGKTEIAAEYLHRNIDKYEIIWWIRAEHHDRVRDALVKLGQRLEVRQATTDTGRDRTIEAVLAALQSADRPSWLLVYDNAVNPLGLQKYLPASRPDGHIIITSRELAWHGYLQADSVEVSPFTPPEAISFLRRSVPRLATPGARGALSADEDADRSREAGRLAEELGHLPIAIVHAAAYLAETRQTVDEYLSRFAENAHQLLSERPGDSDLPAPVSGTWAMSTALLTPDAEHLFNLSAFFSPEPIPVELFRQDTTDADDPPGLGDFLASPERFRAAASQLHRLSLLKVDGVRDLIQMHRVVQAVTRGRLRQDRTDLYYACRSAVDTLLARSDPGNPDHSSSDAAYDLSLQHLESDHRFLHSPDPALRALIIAQVRRLHLRGDHLDAMQFGQEALKIWREAFGEDDLQVLAMSVEVAIAMYTDGRAADARELILRVRPLLQQYTDGDGLKVLLLCEITHGAVLRARSQFRESLDLDTAILSAAEAAYGQYHERTLAIRHNIALDYRQLGRFQEALEADELTLKSRQRLHGPSDLLTLGSGIAVAHDLRNLGRYQESLDMARTVVRALEELGGRENPYWLIACDGFATALRKAGHHWDALQESEHVVQRSRDYLGSDHVQTLQAATNLINARRAVGDLAGAEALARETRALCLESSPPDALLHAGLVNLASVLRLGEHHDEALLYDEQARKGLIRIYGDRHPYTLAANINIASDLVAQGRLGEAIQLGHETLDKCRHVLGENHPDTLMAQANLSIDEAAAGDQDSSEQRRDDVLRRYGETLTLEHPEARAARDGIRLTAEIDPYV